MCTEKYNFAVQQKHNNKDVIIEKPLNKDLNYDY